MTKELQKTKDLGLGWYANLYTDGSMTLRNCDKGQRIDLQPESVDTLRSILAAAIAKKEARP